MDDGARGVGGGSGGRDRSRRRRGSATAIATAATKGEHVGRSCCSVATTSGCLLLIVLQLRRHGDRDRRCTLFYPDLSVSLAPPLCYHFTQGTTPGVGVGA